MRLAPGCVGCCKTRVINFIGAFGVDLATSHALMLRARLRPRIPMVPTLGSKWGPSRSSYDNTRSDTISTLSSSCDTSCRGRGRVLGAPQLGNQAWTQKNRANTTRPEATGLDGFFVNQERFRTCRGLFLEVLGTILEASGTILEASGTILDDFEE